MSTRRSRKAGSARLFREQRRADLEAAAASKEAAYAKGAAYGEEIRAELATNDPALLVLDRDFETQSVDPMFLEPESGLAWYAATAARTSSSCSACSRLTRRRSAIAFLLGEADAPFKPSDINAHFAYVGGGFGGRDHTPFPLYVALAALFLPGRRFGWRHDRYQQFQGGIKRHAFKMQSRIGVDRATGRMIAFAADHVLDGGGLANFSGSVAVVGATGAIGIYDIPKVDVTTVALHSRGVTAGSMRGYGTLQTMTALEVLIDEAAAALPLDPIEFRRRNALDRRADHDRQSLRRLGPHARDPRQAGDASDLAATRQARNARARAGHARRHRRGLRHQGLRHRCRLFAGSGRNRSRGSKFTIHCDHVEMGNGIGRRSPIASRAIWAPSPTKSGGAGRRVRRAGSCDLG